MGRTFDAVCGINGQKIAEDYVPLYGKGDFKFFGEFLNFSNGSSVMTLTD
jgi:hypothetical protein